MSKNKFLYFAASAHNLPQLSCSVITWGTEALFAGHCREYLKSSYIAV